MKNQFTHTMLSDETEETRHEKESIDRMRDAVTREFLNQCSIEEFKYSGTGSFNNIVFSSIINTTHHCVMEIMVRLFDAGLCDSDKLYSLHSESVNMVAKALMELSKDPDTALRFKSYLDGQTNIDKNLKED